MIFKKPNRKIILHVGHGKTGSSYLQSLLVLNKDKLRKAGILYPDHASDAMAARGSTTSGNGSLLFDPDYRLERRKSVLFSGELLFTDLLKWDAFDSFAEKHGPNLKILLYTRDVFSHAFSRWGQSVKRGGVHSNLDDFLYKKSSGSYPIVIKWLAAAETHGFEIVVRNYSRHKDRLGEVFFQDILDVDPLNVTLTRPKEQRVNRSLTPAEHDVQRIFNYAEGKKSASYISDVLVDRLPDLRPAPLRCSQETYEHVRASVTPAIEEINSQIPSAEAILIEPASDVVRPDPPASASRLSDQQIEALGRSLKRRLEKSVTNEDAGLLHDLASRIEQGSELVLEDALFLMRLAKRARPNDPSIRAKIDDWEGRPAKDTD